MKKAVVSVLASALALAASARTFEVAAWRGETVAARVPDYAELGPAPDGAGMTVRVGVLKSVKYAPDPESMQRLEAFDRVVWARPSRGLASSRCPSPRTPSPANTRSG